VAKDRDSEQQPPTGDPSLRYVAGGPSPLNDIDRAALNAPKSKWTEDDAPAAGDPVSDLEKRGLNLFGNSSVRDGALGGPSDARDGTGGPVDRTRDVDVPPGGPRVSPERLDNANETETETT
jgi:hypothetical protein